MLRFAVDENFNMYIVNGVLRRLSTVDMVRAQDAGLEGEWENQVNYLPLK